MSDNWIDFILQSFSQVLSWHYVKKETKPEEIIAYTEMTLSKDTNCYISDKYIDNPETANSNIIYYDSKPYKIFSYDISYGGREKGMSWIKNNPSEHSITDLDIPRTCKYKGRNYKIVAIDDIFLNVRKINLPDSITYIGNVFENCCSLEKINFPNTIIECADNLSFRDCVNLENIDIPKGLQKICSGCFQNCLSLKQVTIPDTVTEIKDYAFYNCLNLKKINIPENVTVIGKYAFHNCLTLKNIIINEGITTIKNDAFSHCVSLENITIPKSVKEIGSNIFENCYSLKQINIPKNKNINIKDRNDYSNCWSLEEVLKNKNWSFLGSNIFNCKVNLY